MGKSPAQRAKQARREERLATQSAYAEQRHRRKKFFSIAVVVGIGGMLVSTILGGLLFQIGDSGPSEVTVPTTPPEDQVAITVPPLGTSIEGETPCPPADGSAERVTSFAEPPPSCIDADNRYRAVVRTGLGEMSFLLNQDQAPETVNNFVVLARYGFYDGVPFHEIVPGAIVITGDASGDPRVGEGGPGYTIDNEIPEAGVIYPVGTMAMWADEPDANGSRFLIAVGEQASDLPPAFTTFGLLLDGMETLQRIATLGDPTTGRPTAQVTIDTVEIIEEPRDAG